MNSITLSARDVRAVLDLAGRCTAPPGELDGVQDLLTALAGLVRCEAIFLDRFSPEPVFTGEPTVFAPGYECSGGGFDGDEWLARRPEHPIMSGRYGPVTAISDVVGRLEFVETWHYQECFKPAGSQYEIGLELPRRGGRRSVVSLSRGPGRDFDDRDHLVLELVRPHLDAALQQLGRPAPVLTDRQVQIMRLVADGLTNGQIARRLGTSEKTVGKHLENVYARVGAHSRVHAIALCQPAMARPVL